VPAIVQVEGVDLVFSLCELSIANSHRGKYMSQLVKLLQRIGPVAYKLDLLVTVRVHPIFLLHLSKHASKPGFQKVHIHERQGRLAW
jgi:hypothetical protein